jgi:hypothetical protein
MKYKILLTILLLFITFNVNADPQGKGVVSIIEEDNSPETYPWQLKVTNGSLTDNGDGTVSLTVGGSEADTLDTVCDRGATTNQSITINDNDGDDNENMLTIGDSNDLDNAIIWGNVGIGLTNPSVSLEATGSAIIGGSTSGESSIDKGLVVNESGGSTATDDFRAESNLNANAFLVDASAEQVNIGIDLAVDTSDLFIDVSEGNVGIGVTTPVNKLDIEGSCAIGVTYSGTNTATSNGLIVQGNVGLGITNPVHPLSVVGNSYFNGNVGIGDTSPATAIETSGTVTAEHFASTDDADITDNLTAGDIIIDEADGVLSFTGATSATILCPTAGNINITPNMDFNGGIRYAQDTSIGFGKGAVGLSQIFSMAMLTNYTADSLWTMIVTPDANVSSCWIYGKTAAYGCTDHDNYVSPTFVFANENGADSYDYAGVVLGERTQSNVATTHYFDILAMTGSLDGSVDATTTEVGAMFRTGDSGTATSGHSLSSGDWLFEDDIEVNGSAYFDAGVTIADHIRASTSIYRRYYHLNIAGIAPGSSGATWTEAGANNLAGWQLNSATELLNFDSDVHSDWDGTSDFTVEIYFQLLSAGSNGDTVDLKLITYYMAVGDSIVKTQTLADVVTTTDGTQYKMYKATFTVPWDAANDIETGDRLSFTLNLETDTSEIDNILVANGSIVYSTTHIGIEDGDT